MIITKAPLEGLYIIELDIFSDNRGFFVERFNQEKFAINNLPVNFVQDNHSRSKPGVIRGLHAQIHPSQGKLVGVIRGKILDVVVDIRPSSQSFGEHFAIELSDENGKLLWIPEGFAHGFAVISDFDADVFYKVDALYCKDREFGIKSNDKDLAIDWKTTSPPIISERDLVMPSFADYKAKMHEIWK